MAEIYRSSDYDPSHVHRRYVRASYHCAPRFRWVEVNVAHQTIREGTMDVVPEPQATEALDLIGEAFGWVKMPDDWPPPC